MSDSDSGSNNTLIDGAAGKIKKKVATMNAANSGLPSEGNSKCSCCPFDGCSR